VEKNQSGGPKKSGGRCWPTSPDSGGKVKKGKKFSVEQSGVAKSGLWKKQNR
jgi:hypothetical protein